MSDIIKDISLETQVVEKLIARGWHISFAESCTGGMLPARIVNVADASKVIGESVVTYSNEAKIKYAGVSPATIENYNVVSEEVAAEMARGRALAAGTEVAASTTGYAGPSGGATQTLPDGRTIEIPMGTVCFGFYINGTLTTCTKHYKDLSRNEVRAAATEFVLETLNRLM
ncbi:MAG: CinA family protein [Lachnospiraceae bacterium]|nr:CinA family protein [Lachnospiraceae bacterium]